MNLPGLMHREPVSTDFQRKPQEHVAIGGFVVSIRILFAMPRERRERPDLPILWGLPPFTIGGLLSR